MGHHRQIEETDTDKPLFFVAINFGAAQPIQAKTPYAAARDFVAKSKRDLSGQTLRIFRDPEGEPVLTTPLFSRYLELAQTGG